MNVHADGQSALALNEQATALRVTKGGDARPPAGSISVSLYARLGRFRLGEPEPRGGRLGLCHISTQPTVGGLDWNPEGLRMGAANHLLHCGLAPTRRARTAQGRVLFARA